MTMINNKNSSGPDNREVEGLTEVLRLQAEALSRISERMSGMNKPRHEIPPSASEKEGPRETHGNELNLPVLAGDPSLNEESLPVLNSFKQFLDQERRRGRKRFIWGLTGFTVVLACVLAVLVWLNSQRVHALSADIQDTSTRIERTKQESALELKKVAETTAQAVAKNVTTMRSDITRNILWAHSALASNMTTELGDRDREIVRFKEKVSTLEIDNSMLTRQIAELGQRVKTIEAEYLDFLERTPVDTEVSAVTNAPPVSRSNPLTINSSKYGRSVQLRVPKE